MTRHFTDTSPVIMLFFLPIPNIRGVSADAELDDFFILHKSSQRPLYGNLTDVRTFLHDLCFCNFPKRPFDDLANAIRLRQISGSHSSLRATLQNFAARPRNRSLWTSQSIFQC